MINSYSKQGNVNLLDLEKNPNFTEWMYSEIKPFLKGNILEVGSGIGTYSQKIVDDFKGRILLSDFDENYVKHLKQNFKRKNVSVIKLDLSKDSDFKKIKQKIDCVFALNVLEHIQDDNSVLKNIYELLPKGGRFILLVPAHKFLFNRIDKKVGHYRRYTKKELREKVLDSGFIIKKIFYFNFISIFGWFFNGSLLKKAKLNKTGMSLFNRFIPLISILEKLFLRGIMGLSLIAVLEK